MTRQKVKLALIENETSRKSTFKKRKGGLLKKAHELAVLCDVPICVLINSSYQLRPEVWPSREVANKVVADWKMLPVTDQTKKMVNQETFLQQRILKATESLKKLWKENREIEVKNVMFDCISGRTSVPRIKKNDLRDLVCVVDQYINEVNCRAEIIKNDDESSSSSTIFVAATTPNFFPMVDTTSSTGICNRSRDQTEVNLNMRGTIKDLDLNIKSGDEMD